MVTNDMHPGDDDTQHPAKADKRGPADADKQHPRHADKRGPADADKRPEIAIVRYRECQLAAVYGLTDVFRVANEQLALLGRDETVRVSHWEWSEDGVQCVFDSHPGRPNAPTHVVFPPSLVPPQGMDSAHALRDWALARRGDGAVLCGLCAGVFVLAETGLLDHRSATTHWAFAEEFAQRFPAVRLDARRMVVDEGDVITAAGIMAWLDFGLSLVESMFGPSMMIRTSRFMLADAPRTDQLPYMGTLPSTTHQDEVVLLAEETIDRELGSAMTLGRLAAVTATHPRTLQRRFKTATGKTVTQYVQQLRVERANHALATTDDTFESIARSVGYDDPTTLRRLILRETGLTPTGYRQKFGAKSLVRGRRN
ncbi:helix-turn-helix domain-containing protein [Brevibacterium casei]|uniref:GlxA family transcriptional regulator n=1 Tax=Brevibacterium casei TaxID=33889 RepID=UPI0021AF6CC2|nr:helix-turn-helix domain-containing protein [Brevibacterium casei]MCT1765158.1 helix-turn-helix domain-containing protein [Brevibacterium casei]